MAGAGAGADQAPPAAGEAGVLAPGDPAWRDWAGGLPADLMAKVAGKVVAQTEAGFEKEKEEEEEDRRKKLPTPAIKSLLTHGGPEEELAKRKLGGNCLLVFARVCKPWREAQLRACRVGGPLRTQTGRLRTGLVPDVLLPSGRGEWCWQSGRWR